MYIINAYMCLCSLCVLEDGYYFVLITCSKHGVVDDDSSIVLPLEENTFAKFLQKRNIMQGSYREEIHFTWKKCFTWKHSIFHEAACHKAV